MKGKTDQKRRMKVLERIGERKRETETKTEAEAEAETEKKRACVL